MKKGGKRPNAGRKKGVANKLNTELKTMILTALDEAHDGGAVEYLKLQATMNPTAFMTLVGKVLPMTIAGDPTAPVKMQIEWKSEK
jgi:hypothetical protein